MWMSCIFFDMKNITCKNGWKTLDPKKSNGATDQFIHGIQIKSGNKILHQITFPFEVFLTKTGIRFIKDGIETYVGLNELAETRDQVKQIIKSCAIGTYGSPIVKRTTGAIVVDNVPITVVDLTPYLQPGDTLIGMHDVYAPTYVNEGSMPNDYTVLSNGNVQFNTEIPVESEPYVITINFWVSV